MISQKTGEAWTVIESNPVKADFSHPSLDSTESPKQVQRQLDRNPIVFRRAGEISRMGGKPRNPQPSGPGKHLPMTRNPQSAPQYPPLHSSLICVEVRRADCVQNKLPPGMRPGGNWVSQSPKWKVSRGDRNRLIHGYP